MGSFLLPGNAIQCPPPPNFTFQTRLRHQAYGLSPNWPTWAPGFLRQTQCPSVFQDHGLHHTYYTLLAPGPMSPISFLETQTRPHSLLNTINSNGMALGSVMNVYLLMSLEIQGSMRKSWHRLLHAILSCALLSPPLLVSWGPRTPS